MATKLAHDAELAMPSADACAAPRDPPKVEGGQVEA